MYVRPDSVSAHQIAYCFYSIRKFCSAILACHGNDKGKHEWSIFTGILEYQKEYWLTETSNIVTNLIILYENIPKQIFLSRVLFNERLGWNFINTKEIIY